MEMLSPHFSLAEFQHSNTAIANQVVNVLPRPLMAAARALCLNILEPIREHFGVPVLLHSGYRCRALNRAIGSNDTSQHLRGEAADISLPGGPDNADLAQWISSSGLPFDQLILEAYRRGERRSGWVHVSHALARSQRGRAMTMTVRSHGASYRVGIHS